MWILFCTYAAVVSHRRLPAPQAALRTAVLSAGAVGKLAPLLTSPATATDGALRVAALNALAQLVHGHAAAAVEVAAGTRRRRPRRRGEEVSRKCLGSV